MLIMAIHFNQGTLHIMAKKGVTCALGGLDWGWGSFAALAAPSLYAVSCCGTDIHCYVCMINDLFCTFLFCKTSYL